MSNCRDIVVSIHEHSNPSMLIIVHEIEEVPVWYNMESYGVV
jgi:hypothetical protein